MRLCELLAAAVMAGMLDDIRQDLRLAVRSFAKNRTFSIVAVMTLHPVHGRQPRSRA